jgi:hypothetical protein
MRKPPFDGFSPARFVHTFAEILRYTLHSETNTPEKQVLASNVVIELSPILSMVLVWKA